MAGRQVRTAISIPDDLHSDLVRHIPWGFRRHMLEKALRLMTETVKRDGSAAITDMIDGKYVLRKSRRR